MTPLSESYRVIITNRGKYSLIVDDSEFEKLSKMSWCVSPIGNKFYALHFDRASKGNRRVCTPLHRLIMDAPSGMVVDHINGDTLDNRRQNLRLATHQQNCFNQPLKSCNTSGYKGVSRNNKRGKPWRARIRINGKETLLGTFDTPEEAHAVYCIAAAIHHGKFANFG